MLIKCPECFGQVSDKAVMCPHCGYPISCERKAIANKPKRSHKRLPNGFGQITEIKGKGLRKPFRAMVTVGKNEYGKPICRLLKPVSYFATYNEAYEALVEYNRSPYDLDETITVGDLYPKWFERYKLGVAEQSLGWCQSAWNYCTPIKNIPVKDVRVRHVKECVEHGYSFDGNIRKDVPSTIRKNVKFMLNMLMDYALEYDLTDKNYARIYVMPKYISKEISQNRSEHISFTDEEMKILWNNLYIVKNVDMVLIQCYTGLRPMELCSIKLENVYLDDGYIIGGMKTDAGKDRVIPIHSSILDLVRNRYNDAKLLKLDYLFTGLRKQTMQISRFNYDMYKDAFYFVRNSLGLSSKHKPHDPRKQFVTMAKKYNVNEYALKRIVGHSITDLTEKVYTDRDISWLKTEMEKIKVNEYITNEKVKEYKSKKVFV